MELSQGCTADVWEEEEEEGSIYARCGDGRINAGGGWD